MKKFGVYNQNNSTCFGFSFLIFSLCLMFFSFFCSRSMAQCEFDSPGVVLNTTTYDGTNCQINIDLSFDLEANNGNKFIFVHLWTMDGYATVDHNYTKAPNATRLGPVLATMVVDNNGSTPVLLSQYNADGSVVPLFSGLTISKGPGLNTGFERFFINNITLTVPGSCNQVPSLKGDAWSTQANSNNPTVHCSTLGFELVNNNMTMDGGIMCNGSNPNTYNMSINTTSTTPFSIDYKVYLDDGDGILEAGTSDMEVGSGVQTISSTAPFSAANVAYTYAPNEIGRSLWLVASGEGVPYFVTKRLVSQCSLPVKMAYFRAIPLDKRVNLVWETTEESNSAYFDIERSSDAKEFSNLGRIQAQGDYAGTKRYSFNDQSPIKGTNYYRLKQVDQDGKFVRSHIVPAVFDENSALFEIMGNPSGSSEIHFLFRNLCQNNLKFFDSSGKSLPFSLSNQGNHFYLHPKQPLTSGIYILRTADRDQQFSRKILIH